MKGYFCIECGEEVPVTIKNGIMYFYSKCTGDYRQHAFYREIDDKKPEENEIEIHDVLDVPYYSAREKVKEYLRNNVFVSAVAEQTCLDFDIIKEVLYDLYEFEGELNGKT